MKEIFVIFALWIVGSSYPMTRSMSIAPSTFSLIDLVKRIDNMTKKKPLEMLLHDFKQVHGNRYCYEQVNDSNYKNNKTKIPVLCKEHGIFYITPYHHIKGVGCAKCGAKSAGDKLRKSKKDFISQAKSIHGDKYSYEKVEYINSSTKVCITCHLHGDFYQLPLHHLKGTGCPKCGGTSKKSLETFIEQANITHHKKYDYKKTIYVNDREKVIITCPVHGDFLQSPNQHIKGHGCPYCGRNHNFTTEEFASKANKIHSFKYEYNKTKYVNSHTIVTITCPLHGDFEQKAYHHLNGSGCPVCKSSLGENKITFFLKQNKIDYIAQYKILNEYLFCKNKFLYVDFYLSKYNTIIEFNGSQHYVPTKFFSYKRDFQEQQERDDAVRYYCKEHGVKLIEIPYTEYDNIEKILTKELNIYKTL